MWSEFAHFPIKFLFINHIFYVRSGTYTYFRACYYNHSGYKLGPWSFCTFVVLSIVLNVYCALRYAFHGPERVLCSLVCFPWSWMAALLFMVLFVATCLFLLVRVLSMVLDDRFTFYSAVSGAECLFCSLGCCSWFWMSASLLGVLSVVLNMCFTH